MPIHAYECEACGHQFETLQRVSDGPLLECPKCHQEKLTRLVSASSFHLVGGGWASEGYSKAPPGEKK